MSASVNRYVAIVDDDDSVARAFARLLRSAGYQPITYHSAEAFLGDDKQPRFDCLVLDFHLQGSSGLELARRLAAVKDPTPVLPLTARDEPDDLAAAQAAGCAGYFRKTDMGSETDALDRLHSTAESHERVMVLEVMGRHAGWIALFAGVADGADVILLPEIPFSYDAICEKIRSGKRLAQRYAHA